MTLENLTWLLCGTLLPSFFLCWSAVWLVRRWAIRWQLVDRPGARKVHTTPTPLGGGVAIWIGVVACFAAGQVVLWLDAMGGSMAEVANLVIPALARPHLAGLLHQSLALWVLLGGGTVLMVVGLLDDRRGLGWQVRSGDSVCRGGDLRGMAGLAPDRVH